MRTAGLPNFRKLYGKFDRDLEPGTYYVSLRNRYDVTDFDGKKYFVLSTSNMLGGKNFFLAYAYIGVGTFCLLVSVVFACACCQKYSRKYPIELR